MQQKCYKVQKWDVCEEILKDNWNSPLDCIVSLFNIYCNTNITKTKKKLNIFNTCI